MAVNNCSW